MNREYHKLLEAAIDRELKQLPPLNAPPDFAPRVMLALQRQVAAGARRAGWQTWSLPVKALSFLSLTLVFTALCYGGWQVAQAEPLTNTAARLANWLGSVTVLWSAFNAVLSAFWLGISQLGAPVITGLIAAALLGYAMCIGLGTVYFRLAFAKR